MQIKKVGIICSDTISDGLMMMCATHRLSSEGAFVITFNDKLHELTSWFPGYDFAKKFDLPVIQVIESTSQSDEESWVSSLRATNVY